MDAKPHKLAGLPFYLADSVVLGGYALALAITAVFNGRLERPAALIGRILLCAAVYIASLVVLRRLRLKLARFFLRTVVVQLSYLTLFMFFRDLQLLFFTWNDDRVLAWEKAVFGVQPLVWIQKLYTPWLSEWMFFVYVVYVVIYPVLGAIIYFRRGEAANEDYLFHLGLVNLLCGLGFMLFPVAGPLRWDSVRPLLTEPLRAGPFGAIAEYMRTHVHSPGGTIPSPHCAVATAMWFMAKKYTKRGFWLLSPVILSLYVSTVYGRFHYVSDMVIGIALAVLVLLATPGLQSAWARWPERQTGGRS